MTLYKQAETMGEEIRRVVGSGIRPKEPGKVYPGRRREAGRSPSAPGLEHPHPDDTHLKSFALFRHVGCFLNHINISSRLRESVA